MQKLMTKQFSKWTSKQEISKNELANAMIEFQNGIFDANLGGCIYKKRIRFKGQGKRGSGRTILCYKKDDKAIYIHGFSKNEKSNLTKKELNVFKELANILLKLSPENISIAINNGDLIEV